MDKNFQQQGNQSGWQQAESITTDHGNDAMQPGDFNSQRGGRIDIGDLVEKPSALIVGSHESGVQHDSRTVESPPSEDELLGRQLLKSEREMAIRLLKLYLHAQYPAGFPWQSLQLPPSQIAPYIIEEAKRIAEQCGPSILLTQEEIGHTLEVLSR